MKPGPRAKQGDTPTPSVWAERLERVREVLGYTSLRAFWLDLSEGGEFSVSYATAHSYHITGGEPSAAYLATVAQRFEVSPAYLLLGEGEP